MATDGPKTGRTTYHRDGSVTAWNRLTQAWGRAKSLDDRVLATLPGRERCRVIRHCAGGGR